jgi:aryl-alcohol dehydrogenase
MEFNFSGRREGRPGLTMPSPISKRTRTNDGFKCEEVSGAFFHQSSFATHAIATEKNAVVVDKSLPLAILAPLGCGLQTGAGAVLNTLRPKAGASIAITGCGGVGLSAVMAASIAECAIIIASDVNDDRLTLARELGATHTLNPRDGSVVQRVKDIVDGGVRYSIETTANPEVFRSAVDMLQARGVCGLIGGAKLGTEASFVMTHILFGRTVRGILQGDSVPKRFIPQLIEYFQGGRFPIDRLVRHYPFEKINEAIDDMKLGTAIKPVLMIG